VATRKAPAKKKKPTLTGMTRRLDIVARDICKLRAGFVCQKCGTLGDSSSIEWAHIEARKRKGIRWEENNSLALCNSKINNCHRWFDVTRSVPMMWLIENYPEKWEWLTTQVDGVYNAEKLCTDTVDERLVLEAELKKVRESLL
jgi:5-methylcytosine-specific restriction endonuclease McrA